PGRRGPRHDRHLDAEPRTKRILERVGRERRRRRRRGAVGQRDRRERADHLLGARRRDLERVAEESARLEGERAVLRADGVPAAGHEPAHVRERVGDAEVGARVVGADPVELEPEAGHVGPPGVGTVADHRRPDVVLPVRPHPEEPGALRRAHPLVAVAGVIRRAERAEVDVDHAAGVRTVDERVDAAGGERRHEPGDREDEARRARHVVDEREPRPRRDAGEHGVDDGVGPGERKGHLGDDHARAPPLGGEPDRVAARVVGVARHEQLVPGGEAERADDRVHPGRRVRDEREVVGGRAEERRERRARRGEEPFQIAHEEVDRLALHARPPALLRLEHGGRTRAERPVVQERDGRIEGPPIPERRRHARDTLASRRHASTAARPRRWTARGWIGGRGCYERDPMAAPGERKWLIAISVMLGTILEVLDTSIVNVALPHMQGAFSASVDEITWVLTSYLVANGIVIPMTGWLSVRFGRKRYFITSIVVFTVASMFCGAAPDLRTIVLFRIVQGLGGAAMLPSSQAILMETFPPDEQAIAMATWGVGLMVAPVVGPTLGGWITDTYSWR